MRQLENEDWLTCRARMPPWLQGDRHRVQAPQVRASTAQTFLCGAATAPGVDVGVDDVELQAALRKHAVLHCHKVALAELHPLHIALQQRQCVAGTHNKC